MESKPCGSFVVPRSDAATRVAQKQITWNESPALSQQTESGQKDFPKAVLKSTAFKLFFALLLFVNLVLMIIETDQRSLRQRTPPAVIWGMRAILLLFTFEILIKVTVEGKAYFQCSSNILDCMVVVVDIAFEALSYVEGFLPPNMSWLRLLRLLRLMKFARTFTMLRELAFMLNSLAAAMRAIVWAIILLLFITTFCSIVAVHVVQPLNEKVASTGAYDGCGRCPRAFQTVMDANLTFLQTIVAGDSWGQVSIPIMEMFPWTAVLFSSMLVMITLGVMNLILTCIVDKAMESRENDKEYQLEMKRRNFETALQEMVGIWKSLDQDGNGLLSRDELQDGFNNIEAFAKIIRALDLRRHDIERLFQMMDKDGSERVDYEEFVLCLHQLEFQNPRTATLLMQHDLQTLKCEVDRICCKLNDTSNHLHTETASLMEVLDRLSHQMSINKSSTTDAFASATVASAPSLDSFAIKLEQRFSALLHSLMEEEQLWSSSVRIAASTTINTECEDIVPFERQAIKKQANNNIGGSGSGGSCHGGTASLSSSIKDSSISNARCIKNGSHSDGLSLPSHSCTDCNVCATSTSSIRLIL